MRRARRWDPCISHRGAEVQAFVTEYFGSTSRRVLLIAGAGFDPRARVVATALSAAGAAVRAILLREVRPESGVGLAGRADENESSLREAIKSTQVTEIEMFGSDGAVVGGRNAVQVVSTERFDELSDIAVDLSALSVGTSFPIVRLLLERFGHGGEAPNVHLFVAHDPDLDSAISPVAGDAPGYVHGFKGGSTLDASAGAAKLWLPQLAKNRRGALNRLHEFIGPHDTCPILPFPASAPRLGDELAETYLAEIESAWAVDTRNLVYADESDPLDLYRTVLQLDDLRNPVFREVGGSMLVLSPLGSKVMALGALMAALERDLPVAYLEAIGYRLEPSVPRVSESVELVHIWLAGDAYPPSEPRC